MESNYRYYKTGGMHEWYKFELTKMGMNNESKEFENNKKLKVKIIDITAKVRARSSQKILCFLRSLSIEITILDQLSSPITSFMIWISSIFFILFCSCCLF